MKLLTNSGPLGELLNRPKPVHLYHYTGPAGVIGILSSRTLWAGRPADMNDATEQILAREYALEILSSLEFPNRSFGEGMVQYALEHLSHPWRLRFEGSRAYTVSLTSERDSLEQWRAYCPRSGGVALGFSTDHLVNVAADQGFILVPCVYDRPTHREITGQIVKYHLGSWNKRRPLEAPRQGISSHLVRDFIADLERFAPLLKHPSFAAEREWRLISPLVGEGINSEFIHVPSASGIKQFQSFSLLTAQHPSIPVKGYDRQGFRPVIGPNLDPGGMEEAIRTLVPREFGWLYGIDRTESPYR
ncbi:DUF2971 domain-containing protein [Arthrobacter sp. efr-133-TYG-104]|uniref:DUF2971 domain-containing protein n=1 Tax=Arthrobacter sp. efr-133-TYG-104 TaxID=3040324 RepID=UPI00254D2EF9|nr:DUF2971 domain-containing protein [Arthrobacter sp. efr-133-TYG-104]